MSYTSNTIKFSDDFSSTNQIIFMAMPVVVFILIFLFRKQFRKVNELTKKVVLITLGSFSIFHELMFDIDSINNGTNAFDQLVLGNLELCRFNAYMVGIGLILLAFDKNMLKWVAGTALFGGYSTLVDHYPTTATIHSLITHSVILCLFPAFAFAMKDSKYTNKDLKMAFVWNLTYVMVAMAVNYSLDYKDGKFTHSAGVLSPSELKDNMIGGFAYDIWPPLAFVAWIGAVIVLQFIFVGVFRLVNKIDSRNTESRMFDELEETSIK